jgi:hypothetical protein
MTFGLASFISIFIPGFISLRYLNSTETAFKTFNYFMIFTMVVECIGNFLFYSNINNNLVFTVYIFIETLFIGKFIHGFSNNMYLKKIGNILFFVFLICAGYRINKIGYGADLLHSMRFVSSIFIIYFAGVCIVLQTQNANVFLLNNPLFIIFLGLLLYHGVSVFIFGLLYVILKGSLQLVGQSLWVVHSIVNIVSNLLFGYSIWLSFRQRKLLSL